MYREIKSYVLRAGRVTPRQQLALEKYLPKYQLNPQDMPWHFQKIFANDHDVVIEVGFGMGQSLLAMARDNPLKNYIGIEVHLAGVGSLVASLHAEQLTNVRVATFDAIEIFQKQIADRTLSGVQIFFPDPWPKKKHHKRRIINEKFVNLLADKIKSGGFLHCATDWQDYAEHMIDTLNHCHNFKNQNVLGQYVTRPEFRPLTKFEQRGLRLGHQIYDLIYIRQ